MAEPFLFADVLQRYVSRLAYTTGQLSRLSGIPKATIVSWMTGQVKRPHSAESLSQLAQILHLNRGEAEELIRAAGHSPLLHFPPQSAERPFSSPFQAIPKLPYFVGRKRLIAQIETAVLAESQRNVVCLHGMGGVGKTALAAQIAYRLRASFPDGVLWAEVNRAGGMAILSTMAHGYGLDVTPYQDIASRARVVRQLLVDKQFFLVLDDVQSSAEIADIMPTAANCAVLITTRRQDLAISIGGQRFDILPFEAEKGEALSLFKHIFQRVLGSKEAAQIEQIAHLLGHLPLALAIAASRLAYEPGWQAADFLARLQQSSQRQQMLAYDGLSVQLSFAISYERLPLPLQQFLADLAIFNGRSFTDTAVAAITQQPLPTVQDNLRALHNLSLVQSHISEKGIRYSLHPLLSDCIQGVAQSKSRQKQIRQQYVHYYLPLGQKDSKLNFEIVAQEATHLWAAMHLADSLKMWPEMLAGLEATYPYLKSAFPLSEVEQLLQKAELAAAFLNQDDVVIRYQIRRVTLARQQSDFNRAIKRLDSLTILTSDKSHAQYRPAILLERGKTAVFSGNWIAASKYYEEGVYLAQKMNGSQSILIDLWQAQGNLARWRSQSEKASSLYKQALAQAQRTQDKVRLAALYDDLSWLAIEEKEYDAADSLSTQGLEIVQRIDHKEQLTALLNTLSVVRYYQGDWAGSNEYQQIGFDLARTLHLNKRSASIAANRGGLAWKYGRFDLAEQYWQESDKLAQQSQDVNNLVHVRLYRAEKYLQDNQYQKSLTAYRAVLAALPPAAVGKGCGYARGVYGMALSLLGLDDKKAAKPHFNASLAAFALVDAPMTTELRSLAHKLYGF